ncbi:DUF1707 SHOCT-like domain-containing protein [Nocardia africana]
MSSSGSGMPGMPAPGSMRARDMDRVRARTLLDAAFDEGQLGADEYHDRSDRAATAKTVGELRNLVDDLQPPAGGAQWKPPPGPPRRVGRYPAHIRARDADRAETCRALDTALADGQLSAEEHRTLTDLTTAAETLGDLAELTADLQRPAEAPIDPRTRVRSRTAWFVGAAAVVVLAAAVGGYLLTHRAAPEPAPVVAAAPQVIQPVVIETPDLTTVAGFEKFRSDYQAKFGDTTVDELSLFPDHASVDRTSTGQPNRVADYLYRGGFMASTAVTTRSADKPIFDLATVNTSALGDLIARAVPLLKVPGGAVSHIGMGIDTITKAPTISIYVGNSFNENAFLEATPAGDPIRVYPFHT